MTSMHSFWPSSGFGELERNERGWLLPTDGYLRLFLARPELALVPESCKAELALHAALVASPSKPVSPNELEALRDADARDSYTLFLRFRDGLLAAGSLEACYLSHGLVFTMTRARSGLKALAGVLQKWVRHFLGVAVSIKPLQKIDDDAWRWHVGLDAQASALLNDLYEGRDIEPGRMQRLVSLFRLDFANPLEMRAEAA